MASFRKNLPPPVSLDDLKGKIEGLEEKNTRAKEEKGYVVNADVRDISISDLNEKQLELWLKTRDIISSVLSLKVTDNQEKVDALIDKIYEIVPLDALQTENKDMQGSQGRFISLIRNKLTSVVTSLYSWSLNEDNYEEIEDLYAERRKLLENIKKDCEMFLT